MPGWCGVSRVLGPLRGRDGVAHGAVVAKRVEVFVPGVGVARSYRWRWLRPDVVSGVGLTALLVPQGMAYAELAGLPPVTGLYTTVVALVAYALFGPSRVLVLGPDSALGPLIAAALVPLLAGSRVSDAIALAAMLALLMGVLCIAAGLARLGVLSELLSKPVRVGFLNGIALVVLVGQLPHLFGFSTDAHSLLDEVRAFVEGVADGRTVPAAVVVGCASLVVIAGCRRIGPAIPGVLVAVVGAGAATALFDLTAHGLPVVGPIPSGFPSPSVPGVGFNDMTSLLLAAAGMAFVVLADTATLSRTLASRRGEHVDMNQEIIALGTANIAAGIFQGFPVSASASRTAVAESTGARTQLTGVIAAVGVLVVLFAATGLGRNLPVAALAAVIIAAASMLLDVHTMAWLWRIRRSEFLLCAGALLGVAILGVLPGVAVAIALSVADFVRRAWRPYDAVLGRVPGRKGYHDIDRHPEAAQIPGLVLYRFDAPLFFANAEAFTSHLDAAVAARDDPIRWIIIAAEPITDIDTTAAEALRDILDGFAARGIVLAFAELKGPVKDRLRTYGLYDRIGDTRFFPTLGTAIDGYLHETRQTWTDPTDLHPDQPDGD
jgi:high affinity sulfate transporter 1